MYYYSNHARRMYHFNILLNVNNQQLYNTYITEINYLGMILRFIRYISSHNALLKKYIPFLVRVWAISSESSISAIKLLSGLKFMTNRVKWHQRWKFEFCFRAIPLVCRGYPFVKCVMTITEYNSASNAFEKQFDLRINACLQRWCWLKFALRLQTTSHVHSASII